MRVPGLEIGQTRVLCSVLSFFACKEQRVTPEPPARPLSSLSSPSSSVTAGSARPAEASMGPAPSASGADSPVVRREKGSGPFAIGEVTQVAPAGPAAAHELGVVMIDKRDQVLVARREPEASEPRAAPGQSPLKGRFSSVDRQKSDFASHARGPFVSSLHAHWVSQGRLVRRRVDGQGDLEVLATDARTGTRVTGAAPAGAPVVVAYVTRPDESGTAQAKLWVEGGKSQDLTPDGSGTSSVALVAQSSGYLSLTLDGRSAMTPLHARKITRKGNQLAMGQDMVIWVGASAQPTTEIFGAALGDDAWAFVPIEQDVLHFGLAQIHVGSEPRLDAKVSFTTYPNGLNSAPVAATPLCGKVGVVYALPASREPRAPVELVLSSVQSEGLDPGEVVARARTFTDVSLAKVSGGGLLVYIADQGTWAVPLRCRD